MLPEKKKGDALVKANEINSYKIALLENESVQDKLTTTDKMIAKAGTALPIRAIDQQELVKTTATIVKFVCRDLGIRDWNNSEVMKYDATRFYQTLKKYYSDLSINEVKVAFELAAVGELDEFLPKDKNGQPDNGHYQSFSLAYYTKILKAYRAKKNKVWNKATKALPTPEVIISQEERDENRAHFLQDIYQAFYLYKFKGIRPKFELIIFAEEFVKQDIVCGLPNPSEKSKRKAYVKELSANISKMQRNNLSMSYHKNIFNYTLDTSAKLIEYNLFITKIFATLIRNRVDIKTVIK